jgi:hypothetical protein
LDKQVEDPTNTLKEKVRELKKQHRFEEALILESQIEDLKNLVSTKSTT